MSAGAVSEALHEEYNHMLKIIASGEGRRYACPASQSVMCYKHINQINKIKINEIEVNKIEIQTSKYKCKYA